MRTDYRRRLEQLADYLADFFMTARDIREALGCSMPVAYGMIEGLVERGWTFRTRVERRGRSGPPATAYHTKKRGTL